MECINRHINIESIHQHEWGNPKIKSFKILFLSRRTLLLIIFKPDISLQSGDERNISNYI